MTKLQSSSTNSSINFSAIRSACKLPVYPTAGGGSISFDEVAVAHVVAMAVTEYRHDPGVLWKLTDLFEQLGHLRAGKDVVPCPR